MIFMVGDIPTELNLAYSSPSDYTILDENNNTVPFETEQTGYGFEQTSVYDEELVYHFQNKTVGDTTAWDSTGQHNATIVGATVVDGVSGKGLSFDGSNDYIHLTDLILI